jgi:8-oxo-dGTP pyrophosphatase MutT (NUDIX family)
MTIHQRASRVVYENRWMRVREDEIQRADGSEGIFGVVEKPDFALIVPRTADGGFWLVEQYRYPVGGRYWEFPQGSWEQTSGEDPAELARGELAEETGLRAGALLHLGHLYEAYGYCTQGFDVWLATDLEHGPPQRSVEEQDMRGRHVSRAEWDAMLRAGEVKDAPSVAAYGLVLLEERARPNGS